jgi:hypothetical protein
MKNTAKTESAWPLVVQAGAVSRTEINLSTLPKATKRAVWPILEREAPALAALLTDNALREAAARFQGEITIERADLPQAALNIILQAERDAA